MDGEVRTLVAPGVRKDTGGEGIEALNIRLGGWFGRKEGDEVSYTFADLKGGEKKALIRRFGPCEKEGDYEEGKAPGGRFLDWVSGGQEGGGTKGGGYEPSLPKTWKRLMRSRGGGRKSFQVNFRGEGKTDSYS